MGMTNTAARGSLFVVAAPSGAGKTSLTRALLQATDRLHLSVSHTTRAPRPGEENGREYHFVDDAEFDRMIQAGEFLEHANVFGFKHRYGTSRQAVEQHLNAGRDVLLEIDWQGVDQIKAALPEAQSIFILPPSRQALEERLKGRGTDSDEVIAARMSAAENEMQHFGRFDYLIINDDFEIALSDIKAIVHARQLRCTQQRYTHLALLQTLLPEQKLR